MFDAWGVYITREGILSGLFLSARIVMLLWASSIFVWSTPLLDILDGTASAMKFFRIPAGPVIMSTSIALNFVPILIQSAKKVKLAQLARGAEEPSGFLRQVRNTASLALPLFAEVFRSADSLAEAMDTRCYSSVRRRTQYRALRLSPADWWLAGGLIPYALLVLRAG
jgi:energy-coupling factor transport system permease protein